VKGGDSRHGAGESAARVAAIFTEALALTRSLVAAVVRPASTSQVCAGHESAERILTGREIACN
jgi:hypothetical protein